jgi:hypothetical protein
MELHTAMQVLQFVAGAILVIIVGAAFYPHFVERSRKRREFDED